MASSLRELRQRRNSVATTKKITRAMELIAASRIVKAQQAVRAALPYADALVHAVSALATYSHVLSIRCFVTLSLPAGQLYSSSQVTEVWQELIPQM